MYGVPPRGHFQGQTRDNSNTRLFHTKKENIHMCSYIISVVYICRIISCVEGFTLFYHIPHTHTHTWKAYVAGNLLKIKNRKNEACL